MKTYEIDITYNAMNYNGSSSCPLEIKAEPISENKIFKYREFHYYEFFVLYNIENNDEMKDIGITLLDYLDDTDCIHSYVLQREDWIKKNVFSREYKYTIYRDGTTDERSFDE